MRRIAWLVFALWTLAVAASVLWNTRLLQKSLLEVATHDARTSCNKDLFYLLNSAFMTREVHAKKALAEDQIGHLTSMKPLNPKNAPDAWEAAALRAFERGRTEVVTFEPLPGPGQLRFMKPVVTTAACLECHTDQGYHVGKISGGISIAVPLDSYLALAQARAWPIAVVHAGLWALGMLGISLGARQMCWHLDQQLQAEAAMHASEVRYRRLFDAARDGILILDAETGMIADVNPSLIEMLGYSREAFLGKKVWELGFLKDLFANQTNFTELQQKGYVRYEDLALEGHDGQRHEVEFVSNVYPVNHHKMIRCNFHDITERKRAEQHLRDSAALYQSLVENLPQHVFRKDRAGRFMFGNDRFCQSLGQPLAEILGKTDLDFCPPALAEKYRKDDQRVVETGQPFECEEEHRQASGKTIFVHVIKTPLRDAAGNIIGVQGISWDITERKQIDRQMQRTDRLESIGTLAGGIAHDLNNTLAPIMMSAELLRVEFPDPASRYLDMIQASAKRGADLVKQLLTFAKGAEGERLLLQPKHLLKEMAKLINSTFLKGTELRTRYAKDLWTVLGDATQLHQVLLNLCVNARDAMPGGGTLTLEAENKEIDAPYAGTVPEAKPGRYVVWRVTDTGTGIPPEVLDRIFEPFFTTKGPEKGTGLGLSTVIGIVKGHGGFIHVYSIPGQGSTFAVYLPAYGAGADDAALLTKADTGFRGDGETILVVDDEVAQRNILRDVLTKLNFKVLTASDGTAALIQVPENRTKLCAVITDLHMPHMDGLTFVRVFKGHLPQAGIIVVSGRVDESAADELKQLGVHAVLEKPFTQEKLVEALKTIFPK